MEAIEVGTATRRLQRGDRTSAASHLRPLLSGAIGDVRKPLAACGQVGVLLFLAALVDAWWAWVLVALLWAGLELAERAPGWPGGSVVDVEVLVANYLLACDVTRPRAAAARATPAAARTVRRGR